MSSIRQQNIGSNEPATKGDIEELREDIHADMVGYAVSKEEFQEFKEQLNEKLDGMEDRVTNRVIIAMQAFVEQLIVNRDEVHQDQLDIVAGKTEAPAQWRSIPRRLKIVEQDVEKIKDKLA